MFGDLITELSRTGAFVGELRTKLDLGTEMNAPPVVALHFDADLLGVMPSGDDSGED